jgi:tetratricopeptide (TPR) repeat protein
MVMKYINPRAFLAVVYAVLLTACAGSDTREGATVQTRPMEGLMPTSQYLPVVQLDEAGLPIRYQPRPNPYTQIENQLDRRAVTAYIEAQRAFDDYDFERADRLLEQLESEESQLSGPRVLRGDIAMERGDLQAAVDFYEQALEVNPINTNAWTRLAKAQRMQGQFQRAQNTYAQALQRWPDGAELHWNLGVLYDLYLNMPEKAQAHMEAYQLLSGDNSGEVAAWLEEVRQRTGMDTALAVRGAAENKASADKTGDNLEEAPAAVASKSAEE